MSYMTISSQEKHNFSLCSCFHAHPTTLLLKILGGPMHGRSPHLKIFGGTVPPVPPRSPPCPEACKNYTYLQSWRKNMVTNYRPISILPFFWKILEKLMANRLSNYMEHHALLSPSQFGFRHGLSTYMALLD